MTKDKMTVLYIRCSLDSQDLNHQINSGTKYANENGMTIDKIISDQGVSGYSTSYLDRNIMKVLEYASEGKLANVIIFSTDRISRNFMDGLTVINHLTRYGVKVWSVNEGQVNANDLDNVLNSIRFYQSMTESKKTSQRIRSKKELMRKEGLWLGNHLPKFGYKIDENKKIIVNEAERPIVLDFFQTYLAYGNAYTIKYMKEKYNISICRCVDLIKNRIFIGHPYKTDEYFEYLRIVPQDLWDKCQEMIEKRKTKGTTQTNKSSCLCESILYHKCQGKMYISYDKSKYIFYRCNKCKGSNYKKSFSQYKVDELVDGEVSKWFDRLSKDELLKRFNSNRTKELKNMLVKEKRIEDLLLTKKQTLRNGENKLQLALEKDYPLDMIEVITSSISSLKMAIDSLEKELEDLRNKITDEQKVNEKQIQISEKLLDFKYLYSKATVQEKKVLIRNIVEKIIIEDYDKIEIVYKY